MLKAVLNYPQFLSFKNNFIQLRSNTFITNFYTFFGIRNAAKIFTKFLFSEKTIL